ncbi:MAG: L,D-transpeptidase [Gaiellaceae bacterium]
MVSSLLATIATAAVLATHATGSRVADVPDLVARPLHASVVLHAAPGGRALVRVGPRSVFGGPVAFGVVGARGKWLRVTSEALPNEHYGWVERGRDVSVRADRWALHAFLARHVLIVLHDGHVARSIPVAIGTASSPTPTGRFAVAEKLPGSGFASVYGCCILGLTAHQPHPPAGWSTSRAYFIAIHGGSGIGAAVSAGCLHASEADLRFLMRWIPLGTAIRISR